jgi:uncharacterized protein
MDLQWLVGLCAAGAAVYAATRLFERANLYHPARRVDSTPADHQLEFEEVWFVAEDGCRLHGWWIPCPEASGTVLYCHGNAGNIGTRTALCRDLHAMGVHVFIFDYRGYGRSRGWPTEKGTYRDARAAYEVVRARYGDADDPPVVVFGCSLGGAIAVQLAVDKHPRGLILESTFSSVVDVGQRLYAWLPVRWICRYRYDSMAKVAALRVPKLFSHSVNDELIPFDVGERLFRQSCGPKSFVRLSSPHDEAGWNHSPEYARRLREFLRGVLGALPSDPPGEGHLGGPRSNAK